MSGVWAAFVSVIVVKLIGSLPLEAAEAYCRGDMLILGDADGKKVYVRRSAIRMVHEI